MYSKKDEISPPRLAEKFLGWFLKPELAEEVSGDLEEQFFTKLKKTNVTRAKWDYWYQVFNYLRPFALRNFLSNQLKPFFMFKHNLKISYRTLARDRGFSIINIGGLALGMLVALLIGLWMWDELSYNSYYDGHERIANVMQNQTFNGEVETWWSQARQMGPALRDEYGSHFEHVINSTFTRDMLMEYEDKRIDQTGYYMEPAAPDMFGLKMIYGDGKGLEDPSSIMISESVSESLFGTKDPMGEVIRIDDEDDLKVVGVFQDIPDNNHYADMKWVAPWEYMVARFNIRKRTGWGNSWFQCIVKINENTDMATVSAAIKNVKLDHVIKEETGDDRFKPEIFLHSMDRWKLYSRFENGISVGGGIKYVYMFGLIGVFVLILACINFVNLSTARSERRSREVGVRKAIGSQRRSIVGQFFSESYMVTFFAFILALLMLSLILPTFNTITFKEVSIPWDSPMFWLASLTFCGITGFLSGIYPALFLSSFHPVKVLKGTFRLGKWAAMPRKVLVVVQFSVSVALIIGTLLVYQQIQHVKNRPMGYTTDNLVMAYVHSDEVNDHFDVFRNEILATGDVEELTMTDSRITNTGVTNSGFDWPGKDPEMAEEFVTLRVSHEFGDVVDWEILEGRDFSRDMPTDTLAFIANEAAVKYMGMENPVGQVLDWGGDYKMKIIGVVKNMITQSPFEPVKQTLFFINYTRTSCVTMKLKPSAVPTEALANIEGVFKKYDPAHIFEYKFVDEQYDQKFRQEERLGKLASFFTLLAIIISCLGVFGLAAYVAERRSKEISIRKVLGATVPQLWHLLSKEFVLLVLLGCIIAIPLAYYYMNDWLDSYSYRTEINWWVFVLAGAAALLITLTTVSFQAVKAALANPVEALKNE